MVPTEREMRRNAYVDKARAELAQLEERGVMLAGNAFSSVLLVKGTLNDKELAGEPFFGGEDGKALRASLTALGYAPEDWAALAGVTAQLEPLDSQLFALAVTTLAPFTLVLCDEAAADLARAAYADDLAQVDALEAALLTPGYVVPVRGMRVINLGGFEASLTDKKQKQLMWAYLKQLPPLGEPY